MPDPTPNPSPEATPLATPAPASPPAASAPDSDALMAERLENNPALSTAINRLMAVPDDAWRDPSILTRMEGVFAPPSPPPASPSPAPGAPAPAVPAFDMKAAVFEALGGKEKYDLLMQAAGHLEEQKAKAEMDQTYTRLQAEAKAVALKVHPTYYEGAIGEKIARLAVERSLRTGERLEAAAEAEAKEFLQASGELGKKYIEALSPEGKRLVLTAGVQGGPPPNFDPSKMTDAQQVSAFEGMLSEEILKARMGA